MARVYKVYVTCVLFHNKKKLEQKEIPASPFLLDHSLWEKPSTILAKKDTENTLWRDLCGEGPSAVEAFRQSPNTSLSQAPAGAILEVGPPASARLFRELQPGQHLDHSLVRASALEPHS